MASVLYGAMITSLKGKIAGHVFQKGNAVQILRTRGYNKGANTLNRSQVTRSLSVSTKVWRTLNSTQRAAWEALAPTWLFTDKFGNPYQGSGFQVFNSYNLRLVAIGQAPVLVPSTPVTPFDQGAIGFGSLTAGAIDVNWTNLISGDFGVLVFMSPPVSAGRSIRNLRMTLIATDSNVGDNSLLVTSEYQALYGEPPVGSTVYLRIESRSLLYPSAGIVYETSAVTT